MRGHAPRDVVASGRPISDDRAIHLFITARRAARLFLSTGLRWRSEDRVRIRTRTQIRNNLQDLRLELMAELCQKNSAADLY